MIYYTGDIHGQKYEIERFCKRFKPTKDDTIVILGDVAANYSQDERDTELKQALNKLKPTILCIHGNHEIRPWNIPTYKTKKWNGGTVWYEEEYPSVLFAKDGEIYDLEGLRHIAIGGAYSVDKFYRIARGYGWWEDEQPSAEIKQYVEQQLKGNKIDVILSHMTVAFLKFCVIPENLPLLKAYLGIENAPAEAGAKRELHHRVFQKVFDIAAKHAG